jgi:hypothetical protein
MSDSATSHVFTPLDSAHLDQPFAVLREKKDNPKGKVDWFVGYAMNDRHRIAIAALTVNVRYWTVKSSYLAQSLFQAKFKKQFTEDNQKFFNEAQRDLAADGTTATNPAMSGTVAPALPEATSVTQ